MENDKLSIKQILIFPFVLLLIGLFSPIFLLWLIIIELAYFVEAIRVFGFIIGIKRYLNNQVY